MYIYDLPSTSMMDSLRFFHREPYFSSYYRYMICVRGLGFSSDPAYICTEVPIRPTHIGKLNIRSNDYK